MSEAAAAPQLELSPSRQFPEWLAEPPLGLTCAVSYDGAELMTGYLYGVRVTAEAVELQVEG